ncbi:MAG TPA: ATP-binding protein [Candidatus Sulfotelmatobacter sp.]|nr:ATP-binding protein [Candidatus Sulfotelmatobacter sp.]
MKRAAASPGGNQPRSRALEAELLAESKSAVEELQQAQQALRESEKRLNAIIHSAMDAILTVDQQQHILMFNAAAEKMFGCSAADAIGQPLERFVPQRFHATHREQISRFAASGVSKRRMAYKNGLLAVRAGGAEFPIEASISQIEVARKKLLTVIVRDISERRRAERALRSLSDCNEALVRATDEPSLLKQICDLVVNVGGYRMAWVGYAVHDEKKSVRVVAESGFEAGYLKALNLTWADEERGHGPTGTAIRTGTVRLCSDMATDPDFALWREEAMRRGYRASMVLPLKNGEELLGAISIYAPEIGAFDAAEKHLLEDLSNNLSYGITALRARQERRQAEQALATKVAELARSNADLEQFAYAASHDLQEPLRMVTAYTQLLAERYRGRLDADADKFIGYASEGAQRMQVLIRDLLAFSRVGRGNVASGRVDCNALMQQILQTLSSAIEESGAMVTYGELPLIWAEHTQIAQVLQNLVGNAIKFRQQATPMISVQAEKTEAHWLFSVRDNGIGIAPESAKEIFVVFQRLHARAEYPGNGIGLAICKKIIERYGGRIWVESEPGSGSSFKFTIPLHGEDEEEGSAK